MSWWKALFGGSSTSTLTPEPEFAVSLKRKVEASRKDDDK
jgi:hypothetical protein